MYICMYVYECVCVCVYSCVCVFVCVCVFGWVSACTCVCVCGKEASLKIHNSKGKEAERCLAPVRKAFSQGQDILEMKEGSRSRCVEILLKHTQDPHRDC